MLHTDATFRHRKSMSDKNIHQKLQRKFNVHLNHSLVGILGKVIVKTDVALQMLLFDIEKVCRTKIFTKK